MSYLWWFLERAASHMWGIDGLLSFLINFKYNIYIFRPVKGPLRFLLEADGGKKIFKHFNLKTWYISCNFLMKYLPVVSGEYLSVGVWTLFIIYYGVWQSINHWIVKNIEHSLIQCVFLRFHSSERHQTCVLVSGIYSF